MGLRHHHLQMKEKFCLLRCISQPTMHNHICLLKCKNWLCLCLTFHVKGNREVTSCSCLLLKIYNTLLLFFLSDRSLNFSLYNTESVTCVDFVMSLIEKKIKSEFVNMVCQIIFVFFHLSESDCWLLKCINF